MESEKEMWMGEWKRYCKEVESIVIYRQKEVVRPLKVFRKTFCKRRAKYFVRRFVSASQNVLPGVSKSVEADSCMEVDMKILVLIKEVPDMEKVRFDSERGVVDRSSAPAEINPFDESALQAALDLKKTYGAHVTVMTMGPARAEKTLQDAYARGADDGILLTDRAFGGSDTIATSRTLASAIRMGTYDLILCGEKSVDGDTAQVGAETAQLLGLPHAYYVDDIEMADEETVRVSIENLGGSRQVRTMALPALVGVTKNIGKLQLPTVDRKLESRTREFSKLGLADLKDLAKEDTGFAGSPTKVAGIEVPKAVERESKVFREDLDGFTALLKKEFAERGVRIES